MAPFSSGLNASFKDSVSSSSEQSAPDWLSWLDDEPDGSQYSTDSSSAALQQDPADNRSAASLAAMTEVLNSQREQLRRFVFDDPISGRTESRAEKRTENVSSMTLVADKAIAAAIESSARPFYKPTNLEITFSADQSFLQLKQLEDPSSASSRWMNNNRPDLARQFNSDACGLQIGSQPDGTVFKILTSPEGNRWMLTAKGSATVETLADPAGQVLFKNSGRTPVIA